MSLYRNDLENREFDKEAPQNCCLERATIAERLRKHEKVLCGPSQCGAGEQERTGHENKNSEEKPTPSKPDSSSYCGIKDEDLFDTRPKVSSGFGVKQNRLPIIPESHPQEGKGRFPSWLHRNLPKGANLFKTNAILSKYRLNTVCEEAKCPNRFECYSHKTATFLVLGKQCTRNCGFCDIDFSKQPAPPEADEPDRIASSVKELGLQHVVITMVARDDLPDQGAQHIADIIHTVRKEIPSVAIEVLTSDFSGDTQCLDTVLNAAPDVFNHNIETVREWTPRVRHKATYERTLSVLRYAKKSNQVKHIKSGLMVGLGETKPQVEQTISDLFEAGCDCITIGQYLQANHKKLLVKEFIPPERFKEYETFGLNLGVKKMYCGPFVRSSYHAHEVLPIN